MQSMGRPQHEHDFSSSSQVVIVDDFPQLIPIDLAFPATAMTLDFCFAFLVRRGGLFQVVGRWEVQLEQMALPFAFGETLSPATKRPTLVPGQFIKGGRVRLLEFLIRSRRFVQHATQFRNPLL